MAFVSFLFFVYFLFYLNKNQILFCLLMANMNQFLYLIKYNQNFINLEKYKYYLDVINVE